MNRAEKIKELIDSKFHGSQAEFARAIGKASSQVNQWLNGHRNIGDGLALEIERNLGLENWLYIKQNNQENKQDNVQVSGSNVNGNNYGDTYQVFNEYNGGQNELITPFKKNVRVMPLMEIDDAAAYILAPEAQRPEKIKTGEDGVITFIATSNETFSISVADNNVFHTSNGHISNGDIAIIEPKIPPRNNDMVFVCLDAENTAKRRGILAKLKMDYEHNYFLLDDEKKEAVPMPETAVICGVVIEVKRRIIEPKIVKSRAENDWDIWQTLRSKRTENVA